MRPLIYQALLNLLSSKLRSFLAVLGILVGTAAVVALMSSGQLATEKALAEFRDLGTDLLAVNLYLKDNQQHDAKNTFPVEQWYYLSKSAPDIKAVAPFASLYQQMSFQGKTYQGSVIAADESLADLIHIEIASGYFVSHVFHFERYCVIGHQLAQEIKKQTLDSPLGKQLKIGQTLFTIIGVLKPWTESGFFSDDINKAAIIPLGAAPLLSAQMKINNAVIRLREKTPIDTTLNAITHRIQTIAPEYTVFNRSAKQIITSMESQGHIFTLLLGIIGGISLLVGGIGVMNVMLVAVTERKKEIGIRKAVGANSRQIQNLFLTESVMLSFLGGILGVILGILVTFIIATLSGWPFKIYLLPPLAGFGVSVITGIFFGFYPARRASQLEPVACLRSD